MMTKLLVQNKKIKSSSNARYRVFNFGIPAYQSQSGFKTCPMAGQCAIGCYAQQGAYTFSNVKPAFEARLELTKDASLFWERMSLELDAEIRKANKRGLGIVVRVHDSGDFYSAQYAKLWFDIARDYPDVRFYAYTKMVPMFKRFFAQDAVPSNFTIIYSEGGLADDRIDVEHDRHARVFGSHEELQAAGYADASKDDLVAALGDSHKIGLVYHGAASKEWTTAINKERVSA